MSDYGNAAPPPGGSYGGASYGGGGAPPNNNLVMAILGLLCCWPLGIPAVVFAAQVNGKWNSGDQAGAVEAADKAKKFGMWALIIGIIANVLGAIFYFVALGAAATSSGSM